MLNGWYSDGLECRMGHKRVSDTLPVFMAVSACSVYAKVAPPRVHLRAAQSLAVLKAVVVACMVCA